MADISHESLICSDLNANIELIRLHTDCVSTRPTLEGSIMIDGYREISRPNSRGRRRRSSSVHTLYTKIQDDRNYSMNTFETIYKKIAAFFFVFNKLANANDFINYIPAITNESHTLSFVRSFNMLYDLRIKERIYDTMDSFLKSNRSATDRIVAMIPSMPINLDTFGISKYFSGYDYSIADCFALFIENPRISEDESSGVSDPNPVDNSDLDVIPSSIRCEIVNKLSQEVLSECGTYECLYEQEIDSLPNNMLDGVLQGVPISKGKIRLFHKIMALGKKEPAAKTTRKHIDEDVDDSASSLKQRFSIFTEYLSRRNCDANSEHPSKWNAKTYFNIFSKKEASDSTDPIDCLDDSAKERFEEHIRMHTIHWDEIQYDNIEIVLRDSNDNSIIKLPYSCTIM